MDKKIIFKSHTIFGVTFLLPKKYIRKANLTYSKIFQNNCKIYLT